MDRAERQVTETFAVLADTLADPFDVIDLLHVLTHRRVEILDVQAAGLMLADPGAPCECLPPRARARACSSSSSSSTTRGRAWTPTAVAGR